MAMPKSMGRCAICGKSFSKSGISRHLNSCLKRESAAASSPTPRGGLKIKAFHLAIEGRDFPGYWLHLEMTADAPLRVLDQFLRYTWLECCGHMSAFCIEGKEYSPGSRVNVGRVLSQGMQFYHRYDFGSMTDLTLRVVSQGDASESGSPIRVLARNDPPEFPCFKCGASAAQICTECVWDGEGFYCGECAALHEVQSPSCDEMFLPVVNSPRMGECAYTGPEEDG